MLSTSRSRGSGREPEGSPRTQVIAPMSERQQLALVMQISSQEALPAAPTSPSPPEEKKKTKNHRSERGETTHNTGSARSDPEHVKKIVDKTPEACVYIEAAQHNASTASANQEESTSATKKQYTDESHETDAADDEVSKRKKRKENDDKEPMAKPAPVARGATGRILTGSKPPGPASKTGASALSKGSSQGTSKGGSSASSGKGQQAQGKGSTGAKGKSSGGSKGSGGSLASKQDRKSPVASPKPNSGKDNDGDSEEQKCESAAPKVPPLKIVIPGGAGGSGNRNEQEGSSGQRGGGKGRGSVSTLPYVIPCTSNDTGQTSDSSDGNCEDKRAGDGGKGQDGDHSTSTSSGGRSESNAAVELHPRKRKIKASKDSHSRDTSKNDPAPDSTSASHNITHSNPYQMYIHIRKQIDRRQRSLFPVKPKPPKDFNKYLMNRCTYTLQSNVNPEPQIDIPVNLPTQMVNEFIAQEKERTRLRIQHLVEKEKLVLAVEQEILRVHGRAERAVANQALPFSVCTMLRDNEVYNVLAPEQEEKRNAQRSRCNGRQINSWLQEVDDKWEKIKVGMLRRQNTEVETLHAVQMMGWEWKLKELGICDYKTTPKIDPAHVPQINVSNFDLPA
ncbi:unnamed protein product [Diatraea saccharalis]|uniref:Ankyrin repeat domain-containing protein 12 n=1 Tax=Diatraea saccharalis TaxID=40085 RepID=A0A9N9QTD4_9NEOP|nr:unnamed protein product [Diatraea saccharalis]